MLILLVFFTVLLVVNMDFPLMIMLLMDEFYCRFYLSTFSKCYLPVEERFLAEQVL